MTRATRNRLVTTITIVLVAVIAMAALVACTPDNPTPTPAETVTVTFKDGDTTVKTATTEKGSALAETDIPADPTKDGYTFDGWYDGETKFDKDATFSADATFTAKYTENKPAEGPSNPSNPTDGDSGEDPVPTKTTLYFKSTGDWGKAYIHTWTDDSSTTWPGLEMTKGTDGWFSYEFETAPANFLFNSGSGIQSANLTYDGTNNYYIFHDVLLEGAWGADADVTAPTGEINRVYFKNTNNWPEVYAYAWTDSTNYLGSWPGRAMTADANYEGWYYIDVAGKATTIIFNNNSNGSQTVNLTIDADKLYYDGSNWVSSAFAFPTGLANFSFWTGDNAYLLEFANNTVVVGEKQSTGNGYDRTTATDYYITEVRGVTNYVFSVGFYNYRVYYNTDAGAWFFVHEQMGFWRAEGEQIYDYQHTEPAQPEGDFIPEDFWGTWTGTDNCADGIWYGIAGELIITAKTVNVLGTPVGADDGVEVVTEDGVTTIYLDGEDITITLNANGTLQMKGYGSDFTLTKVTDSSSTT